MEFTAEMLLSHGIRKKKTKKSKTNDDASYENAIFNGEFDFSRHSNKSYIFNGECNFGRSSNSFYDEFPDGGGF